METMNARALEGQAILITGASGGLGAAIARHLAADGARVVLQYGRDREGAARVLDEAGGRGWLVQADLADPEAPARLWAQSLALAGGRLHGLVNNAGIRSTTRIGDAAESWRQVWRQEFQVNFFAAVDLCREAVAHFQAQGGGRIVNMASRAGQRGYVQDALPYGASKAALINLTKSLAASFGRSGVVAVALAPGWVRTEMAEAFIAEHGEQAAVADIPTGAMATPDEVGELVAFALRPSQRSLNGATLDLNGGSYMRAG